jgi:hypothetical protein
MLTDGIEGQSAGVALRTRITSSMNLILHSSLTQDSIQSLKNAAMSYDH